MHVGKVRHDIVEVAAHFESEREYGKEIVRLEGADDRETRRHAGFAGTYVEGNPVDLRAHRADEHVSRFLFRGKRNGAGAGDFGDSLGNYRVVGIVQAPSARIGEKDLLGGVFLEGGKVRDVVFRNAQYDTDVRARDVEKGTHFARMVDAVFEHEGATLFVDDPWSVRDRYGTVVAADGPPLETFARQVMRAGATEAELAQALATAIQVNAGAAYVYSMRALEAYGD